MKKIKIILIFSTLVVLSSCGNNRSQFDFSKPYYKVEYNLENAEGEYVLDSSRTFFESANAKDIITITPAEISGYTCINKTEELTQTIPESGAITFTLNYRSNATVEVTKKVIDVYDPTGVFNFVGDTIKISRNDLPAVNLIIDNSNTRITGETPDVSRSGETELTTTWAGKDYSYKYTYFTNNIDISDVLERLKVDSYTAKPYNTYNFDIEKDNEKANLAELYKNDIAEPKSVLLSNLAKHAGDEIAVAKDKEDFINACAPAYKKFVGTQIKKVLEGIFSQLHSGVFANDTLPYMNCGNNPNSSEAYCTWIYKDPSAKDLNSGVGDNRWWIPNAYKSTTIIEYANTLTDVPNDNFEAVKTKFDGLLIDCAKCGYLAISEALVYYYTTKNHKLTIDGNDASVWWNVWTYAAESGYSYDGHLPFDEKTVTSFRLKADLFNKKSTNPTYVGNSLSATLDSLNWCILHQIDDDISK